MSDWRFPDARGWTGLGVFALTVMVLWMLAAYPELRQDEYFKTLATLIVGTAFVNGVVSWSYAATKAGGELAERNAAMVERQAQRPQTQPVTVVNDSSDPVPVTPPYPDDGK